MKYYQPETLAEASELLASEDGAKVIAGGQSMMPLIAQDIASPDALVDVTGVDDIGRSVSVDGDAVRVGALVTYRELLEHGIADELDLLRESVEAIGDVQVRNAGTIGGGVAHADPAQDLPPALQCYGTDVVVFDGERERTHDVNRFYVDFYFTELAPHEIVTGIEIRRPSARAGGAFQKHARTPGGFSEAGVAVLLEPTDDGAGFSDARLAYCAGAAVPRRAPEPVEEILADGTAITREDVETAADGLVESLDNVGDVGDYDEAYNEHIFRVLTKRALVAAADRSGGPPIELATETA